jgi:aminopeptidase N
VQRPTNRALHPVNITPACLTFLQNARLGAFLFTMVPMQTVPRLYETFQPSHYDLKLVLEREKRIFSGIVLIDGKYLGGDLTLHAKGLKIDNTIIDDTPVPFSVDAEADALTLDASRLAVGDNPRIIVEFSGTITDPMHGLYPCYYEHDGVKKELLATQFESHHAREVFPCIDEPEAKATFDLALTTEKGVSVLGNMPIKEQTEAQNSLVTTFETTPKMSSYLLAFVVGELQSKSTTTTSGVTVTTWATKAQPADSLDFALDVAKRSIEFFDEYFGVPYPLPKADHVALPDFSSGAMENWGLITYREICLLADASTAISSRQYVATVIAHETSHQWFGNLVTMKWWDDLWLNESFATLMEYVCVDALFPTWKIWTNFATQESLSALRRDYLPGVQAIKTAVNHPDEISTLFDPSIVYAKGARVLRMLRSFVGEGAFRSGLSEYFKTHSYKNTEGRDLWKSLSATAGTDIDTFMKPWLEQPGLPVVSAELSGTQLQLTQKRFVIPAQKSDALWPIPLQATLESIPKLFDTSTQTCEVKQNNEPIVINHDATTHAIVSYGPALRAQLEIAVEKSEIGEVDRLSLLHDMSLLARAGEQTAVELLTLLQRYAHETSEPVWDIIALAIADIRRLVEEDEGAEAGLKLLVEKLALPTYERLGWDEKENENERDTKLRATAIGLLGYSENAEVIERSLQAYRAAGSTQQLPGELRATILALVVKHGSPNDIDLLIEEYQTTVSSELQNDIAAGLTATRDPELITRLVSRLTDATFVRPQDLFRWFAWLIRNRFGRQTTWQWMVDNWAWIEKTFAGDKSYDDFARYSAAALGTKEWQHRYEEFFMPKRSVPALTRAIDLGVADITVRADWHERDVHALTEKLKAEAAS